MDEQKNYNEQWMSALRMNNSLFSKFTDVQLLNLKSNSHYPTVYTKYTRADIIKYLKNPETNAKQLRNASIYLYEVSAQYRRIVNYFAHMCPLTYIMYPFKFDTTKEVNEKAFKASYKKATDFMAIFNLQHEMRKALVTAWREDIFAGYIYQTKDSFYIRKLHPDYVKIASIVDGCYMVAFDFSYFRGREDELESYGEEFISKYGDYKKDSSLRWQLLDEKRQFCLKISEDVMYPLIPLAGCLLGIFDIEDYKELQKGASVLRNYKALGLKLPTDEAGNLLIDKDFADQFYEQLSNITPENIGVFETPMDVEVYDFEKSGAEDPDKTYEAIRNFYNDAGVSALLFGSDKQTAASLNISITSDECVCFAVNRQIERNVNRLLKGLSGTQKFQITILDISEFHRQQFHDIMLKDAQYGVPVKSAIAASLGLNPPNMSAMLYMENEILKLHDNMIPLQSSYTQSSDNEGGRPTAEENGEEISDSNENTREHDSNASR